MDGTSASLSSLQGVSSQMLRHQGPSLTPSLANYFRADLIAHVTNWPADMLEKQVRLLLNQIFPTLMKPFRVQKPFPLSFIEQLLEYKLVFFLVLLSVAKCQ